MDPAFLHKKQLFKQKNVFELDPDSGFHPKLYLGTDNHLFNIITRGQRYVHSEPSLSKVSILFYSLLVGVKIHPGKGLGYT